MDTHKDVAIQGIAILPQIYDSLINFDDEGNLIPGLAVSMPKQPDPVTYIFTLRKGVKFHNGASFDARDVKFSYGRMMNKDISRYWKRYQKMIKSIEVLDPYKLKITLNYPYVAFLDILAKNHEFQIVPRGTGAKMEKPIGTGAFKFVEWIKDDRLTLVRNENYWIKGQPYVDKIIYKPFPEPTIRVLNLKTAKVDVVHNLPAKDAVELKKDPKIKVIGRSGGLTEQFWMNTTKPPFDNKKVRQAISYGIDRETIAKSVFLGTAEVTHSLYPSWFFAYDPKVKFYKYNPEKAKALLKEAGYLAKNPLSFSIQCTNAPIFVDQATIIQSQLKKIGVKAEVMPLEKSYWYDGLLGRKGRDYEASLEDSSDDMTELQWGYRFYGADSYYNQVAYNSERRGKKGAQNPEVVRLHKKLLETTDKNKRKKLYNDILDDAPMIYLSFWQNIIGMRDYVKNHNVLTRNNVPLKEVWVEK
jgi:peptide/nickel transport system substrate-binding protein